VQFIKLITYIITITFTFTFTLHFYTKGIIYYHPPQKLIQKVGPSQQIALMCSTVYNAHFRARSLRTNVTLLYNFVKLAFASIQATLRA
jgi:hypothetical protein